MNELLRCAAALLVLAMAGSCSRPVPREQIAERLRELGPPHVVLVVVDTLRADWTTPYGGDPNVSPELARWAERGVLFERALAQSSWTKSSMASLFTSLWPRSHGVRETTDALGAGALSLAEVFRSAGYRTYAVQSNGWLEQTFGFHQGFERYLFPRGGVGARGMKPMLWPHADNVYREAERLLAAHDRSEPFFLYVHFMDVHEYAAPPDVTGFGAGTPGAYRAAIAWVDEVVGRLRRRLDADGLLERSVMVLASDHGEAFGENGREGHARDVHTQVLHVPLVLRLPFAIEPLRVAAQVRNLDLAPTLLDLAGIAIPEGFEGRSLLPLVTGAEPAEDRVSFASLPTVLYGDAVVQDGVTDARWTLLRDAGAGARERVFDLSVDPGEQVDLARLEPGSGEPLRAALDAHLSRPPAPGAAQPDVRIDPALAQKLRALGYLRNE